MDVSRSAALYVEVHLDSILQLLRACFQSVFEMQCLGRLGRWQLKAGWWRRRLAWAGLVADDGASTAGALRRCYYC
jgi:hypothetical protein